MSEPRFSTGREAAIGLGVYGVYMLARTVVMTRRGQRRALRNARATLALERRLGLAVEPALQRRLTGHRRLGRFVSILYVTLNIGLTAGWLGLLFVRRDPAFGRFRRAWVVTTLAAQPLHLLRPTAPPRRLEGFADAVHENGFDLDGQLVSTFYNPIAAMPSIHVAHALVVGAAVAETAHSPVARAVAPLYPPFVALVVVATANHFVVDVLAGGAVGALGLALTRRRPDRGLGWTRS